MKAKRIFTLLLLGFSLITFAQNGNRGQKRDQIKSLKVAFITNELSLTPEESAKFWPAFNAYEERQRELRRQKIRSYMDDNDGAVDKMTDKEAAAALAQMEDNEEDLYQSRRKLIATLKTFLPATKIIKLKKAEEDFSRKLLRQYRDKRK